MILTSTIIDTPLGHMRAIADDKALYLLEFDDKKHINGTIDKLHRTFLCSVHEGETSPLASIRQELFRYFEGTLQSFTTPIHPWGTPFQQAAWNALCHIPYGTTRSYKQQAIVVGAPLAYRAVAQANGANRFPIRVPCHRIIQSDGTLGGYSCGLDRKQWLLDHETQHRAS